MKVKIDGDIVMQLQAIVLHTPIRKKKTLRPQEKDFKLAWSKQ